MDLDRDRTPADLASLEERLRNERATPTPLELDDLKLRAMRQAAPAAISHSQKGSQLKSRVVLVLTIVLGLMMTTTGATLAISGSSGKGNAAETQYDEVTPEETDEGLGDTVGGAEQGGGGGGGEPAAQVAAGGSDGSLPFTGFFTIPLMLGGVALLTGGAIVRWRSREQE